MIKMNMFIPPELKDLLYKIILIFGVIIVIYGVLWLLVTLGLIPALVAALFPQVVIIIIGLFIIYTAWFQQYQLFHNSMLSLYLFCIKISPTKRCLMRLNIPETIIILLFMQCLIGCIITKSLKLSKFHGFSKMV